MKLGWLVVSESAGLETVVRAWVFTQKAVGDGKHFQENRNTIRVAVYKNQPGFIVEDVLEESKDREESSAVA